MCCGVDSESWSLLSLVFILCGVAVFYIGSVGLIFPVNGVLTPIIEMVLGAFSSLWMTSTLLAVNQTCNSIIETVRSYTEAAAHSEHLLYLLMHQHLYVFTNRIVM
jgi:hypothetical protein